MVFHRFFALVVFLISGCGSPPDGKATFLEDWKPGPESIIFNASLSNPYQKTERTTKLLGKSQGQVTNTYCTDGECHVSYETINASALLFQINRAARGAQYAETSRAANCSLEARAKVTAKDDQFLVREERCENGRFYTKALSNESARELALWAVGMPY